MKTTLRSNIRARQALVRKAFSTIQGFISESDSPDVEQYKRLSLEDFQNIERMYGPSSVTSYIMGMEKEITQQEVNNGSGK